MDTDVLARVEQLLTGKGSVVVKDCHAEHDARRREEEHHQAELEKVYKDANADKAILSFDHWLDNPYYSGTFAADTRPIIRRIANEVFERNTYELVLRGSSGWGKTWLSQLIHKYCTYYLTTFAIPQKAFTRKLAVDSPIVMINLNMTVERAKSSYFSTYRESIKNTGYFQDKCRLKKGLLNRVEFTDKKIVCYPVGAGKHATESENLIFVILDEINFYENVEKSVRSDSGGRYDEAQIIDSAVTNRQENRFINPDGSFPLPVKKILLCKETYKDSYLARRDRAIKEQELDKVDGNGHQHSMVVNMAEWESRRKVEYITRAYPEEEQWFWIVTATRNTQARVVLDKRRASEERKRIRTLKEEGADEGLVPELIKVPTMGGKYVKAAELNIEDFIRDTCGRPVEAIDMYLKDRSLLTKAKEMRVAGKPYPWYIGKEQSAGPGDRILQQVVQHPFTAEATDLNDGVVLLRDRLVRQVRETGVGGEEYVREEPLVAPSAPRFVHLDMGLTHDAAGLAMVAVPGMKDVARWDTESDESAVSRAPWLWLDFVMRFVPPEGGQIRFSAIKSLIREMRRMGFRIVGVSGDGFQTDDLLQWSEETIGAEPERISLDKTPDGYIELQRALTEERFVLYEQTLFETEIRQLERKQTKRVVSGKTIHFEYIDHTPRSSKDLCDPVAGAILHATRKADRFSRRASAPEPVKVEAVNEVQRQHDEMYGTREAMRKGDLDRVFDMTGGFDGGGYNGGW